MKYKSPQMALFVEKELLENAIKCNFPKTILNPLTGI